MLYNIFFFVQAMPLRNLLMQRTSF